MFGIGKEEVHGLRNRVFIISSILIWLRKSNMELMCLEQRSMCFTQPRWVKNTKRDIVRISKSDIRKHNMQHEELFCCHSAEWVEEVRKAVELPDEI